MAYPCGVRAARPCAIPADERSISEQRAARKILCAEGPYPRSPGGRLMPRVGVLDFHLFTPDNLAENRVSSIFGLVVARDEAILATGPTCNTWDSITVV
jgi:hypothetical protein